ncbi:MAG: hypothetical protein NT007_13260 [Candidatus Kapabacteria bacterium]|nr:hypothetical protein [Candidatus Kapabacteria bacterium]
MSYHPKRRKFVEIYFVLYLAALVLLLPDRKAGHSDITKDPFLAINQLPFTLKAEKSNLFCRLSHDTNGSKLLSIDSSNTIFYSGNVENVHFEFIISDVETKQELALNADRQATRFFKMIEEPERNAAVFFWSPPINEIVNKIYQVQVIATARLKNSDSKSGETVRIKTQFSLNINYENGSGFLFAQNNPNTIPKNPQNSANNIMLNQEIEPSLIPKESDIPALSALKWTSFVYVVGISPAELITQTPIVTVSANTDGTAYVSEIKDSKIFLSGKAPYDGKMKVEVSVRRKSYNTIISADFYVSSRALAEPIFTNQMLPGRTYYIDPNLPYSPTQETKAQLRDLNHVRAVSKLGEPIKFTPDISDTGLTLFFERFVNNELVGQAYTIKIISWPEPEIIKIDRQTNSKFLRITTRSQGLYNKTEKNYVKFLEIDGNARVRQEAYGDLYEDPEGKLIFSQVFIVEILDADKPFKFSVRAVDLRGKKSKPRVY